MSTYRDGLYKAFSSDKLRNKDYHDEMESLDNLYTRIVRELEVFKKQRRTLELDIQQAYEDSGWRETPENISRAPCHFMERTYASTVVARVMEGGFSFGNSWRVCGRRCIYKHFNR